MPGRCRSHGIRKSAAKKGSLRQVVTFCHYLQSCCRLPAAAQGIAGSLLAGDKGIAGSLLACDKDPVRRCSGVVPLCRYSPRVAPQYTSENR